MSNLPFRATLPAPLAPNVVTLPGALDALTLMFSDPSVGVMVVSDEALATASLEDAVESGCLDHQGRQTGFPERVALTAAEVEGLRAYAAVARTWEAAAAAGDREALVEAVGELRAIPGPEWLNVQFTMPPRSMAA